MNWLEYNEPFEDDDGLGSLEEKVRHYQKIIRNPAKSKKEWPGVDIIETLVDYCLSTERYKDALEFCGIWLDYLPQSADAFHKRAVILYQLNNPKEALRSIEQANRFAPADKDILLTKALICDQMGNVKSGLEILDSILSSDPGNEDALFRKALLLQSSENYKEALKLLIYLENIEFNPEEIWQELANCYHNLGDFQSSESYYKKALSLKPFDYLIWYNLGVMYGSRGANYRAIDCYKNSLAIKSDFISSLFNLGNSYSAQGRLVEAIDAFQNLLEITPDDIDTMFNLGGAFADNKQYLSAIEYYTKVISLEPNYHQAYFGRGYCYDNLDDYENALKDYNFALNYLPDSIMLLQAKADLLYNSGNLKASLSVYLQALELSPYDEHSLFDVAQLYFELNDLENSELYVKKLIDTSYSYSDAWFLLAKINMSRNNEKKAFKCLIEAIKIDGTKYDEFITDFFQSGKFQELKNRLDKNIKP